LHTRRDLARKRKPAFGGGVVSIASMEAVRRHPVLITIAAVAAAIVITLAGTGIAVWRAAHTDDASTIEHVDAILVLGAAQYDGDPSPVFEGRLEHARLLYEEGRADTILVLGGGAPGDRTTEAEAGRGGLVGGGVPPVVGVPSPGGPRDGGAAGGWSPRSSSRIPGTTCGSSGWRPISACRRTRRRPGTRPLGPRARGSGGPCARRSRTSTTGCSDAEPAWFLAHLERRRHAEGFVEPADQLVRAGGQIDRRRLGRQRRELEVDVLADDRERVRGSRVAVPNGDDVALVDLHGARIEQVVVEGDRDVGVLRAARAGRSGHPVRATVQAPRAGVVPRVRGSGGSGRAGRIGPHRSARVVRVIPARGREHRQRREAYHDAYPNASHPSLHVHIGVRDGPT